jgi:hypothetical protein
VNTLASSLQQHSLRGAAVVVRFAHRVALIATGGYSRMAFRQRGWIGQTVRACDLSQP